MMIVNVDNIYELVSINWMFTPLTKEGKATVAPCCPSPPGTCLLLWCVGAAGYEVTKDLQTRRHTFKITYSSLLPDIG